MESSAKPAPKTLDESVAFADELVSASAGGVAPREVVPIEPGDLREFEFSASAECCRLSYRFESERFLDGRWNPYLYTSNAVRKLALKFCVFGI